MNNWLFTPVNDLNSLWSSNPGMRHHKPFKELSRNQMAFVIFMSDSATQNPFRAVRRRHGDRVCAKEIALSMGWVTAQTGQLRRNMKGWLLGEGTQGRRVYDAIRYYRDLCHADTKYVLEDIQRQLHDYALKDANRVTDEEHKKIMHLRTLLEKDIFVQVERAFIKLKEMEQRENAAISEKKEVEDGGEEVTVIDPND